MGACRAAAISRGLSGVAQCSMARPDPYTLTRPVYCAKCHGPITLEYRPGPPPRGGLQVWTCPHAICRESNVADVLGEVVDCWPGHVEKPAV